MKIIAYEVENWECHAFDRLGDEDGHEVQTLEQPLRPENAEQFEDAEVVSTFMESKLGRDTLEKLEKLKLVATRSTGFDHIDTDYCRQHDIVVSNVPRYGDNTVAEHGFGLLLSISKRINEASDRTRKGDFSFRGRQGFDLEGKTLGVIGTGDIGLHAIRIANGFGMKVLAFDVKHDEKAAEELGFEYLDSLEDVLRQADVVTLSRLTRRTCRVAARAPGRRS